MFEPTTPIQAMQTFSIAAPSATHFRPGTCAEYECDGYRKGWISRVPAGSVQEDYIRTKSERQFTESTDTDTDPDTGLTTAVYTVFTFPPGQSCFRSSEHRVRLDRPELYVVRDGDMRGNPSGRVTRHSGPQPWLDQFGEHLEVLADQTQRG